jgi:hypothetical protein
MKETSGTPFRHSGENRNPGFVSRKRRMNLDSGFRRSDAADEASPEFDLLSLELFLRGIMEVSRG